MMKKLRNLGITIHLVSCDAENFVHNFYRLIIPIKLKNVLEIGLEFNLLVNKPDFFRYFLWF